MKTIFDFIVSFWDTTENPIINWLILGLIYPLAYAFAYICTGKAAPVLSYRKQTMSNFHWFSRIFIYLGLVYGLKLSIWIISNPLILFNVEEPRFTASIITGLVFLIFCIYVKVKLKLRYKIFKP